MRVTIRMIAEKAGVSRGTVDRVLNNRGRVRPEVEERVRAIAEELGYRPNLLGRALGMSQKDVRIGMIVQPGKTDFIAELLNWAKMAARNFEDYGGSVMFHVNDSVSIEDTLEAIDRMRDEGISALAIIPPSDSRIVEKLQELKREGIPVLAFNSDLPECGRFCFIGQDALKAGQTSALLMGGFYQNKKARFAVFSGYQSTGALEARLRGFCQVIGENYPDIELLPTCYCEEDPQLAYEQMKELLKLDASIDGVYITSYGEEGICRALKEVGLDQKVFVCGNDLSGANLDRLKSGEMNLLVGQDAKEQAEGAISILQKLLYSGDYPKEEYIYTNIVIKTKYNIY